jgi:hypothetical protein
VSRETRLLLTAGGLAVAALWLLGRLPVENRPLTPNPVSSVLSHVVVGPRHDDLAGEIADLHDRVEAFLLGLTLTTDVPSALPARSIAALRLRDDLVVALLPPGSKPDPMGDADLLVQDQASGLAVVRVSDKAIGSPPTPWVPLRPRRPRYLMATDLSPLGVSLRPVFVGSLDPIDSAAWPEALWAVPGRSGLTPGSFVFTNDAHLAGLVITEGDTPVIVPGSTLVAEAERLLETPIGLAGTIGVEVQALTPALASLSGSPAGIVVSWIEEGGTATERLLIGDVIETVDDQPISTRQQWDVRMARLVAGETLSLGVRRRGERREVLVSAAVLPSRPASPSLGLALRARAGLGVEILGVERGSAAGRAGLEVGDLITLVADIRAPRPSDLVRSFSSLARGEHVMIGVTRGDAHRVLTLER